MNRITQIIILFVIFLSSTFLAKGNNFIFRSISTERGLSCTQVHTILQDKKGFIWVGTTDGLNRYDGFSFKKYLPNNQNSGSIQGSNIKSLYEDQKGHIWIFFSSGEISLYNAQKDEFTNFSSQFIGSLLSNYSAATSFCVGNHNDVYIGTDAGLLCFDDSTMTLSAFTQKQYLTSHSRINNIQKVKNVLWISSNDGFTKYDLLTKKWSDFVSKDKSYLQVNFVFCDSKSNIWIGTQSNGLFKLNKTRGGKSIIQSVAIFSKRIYKITERVPGEIWVSHNKGISVVEKNGTKFKEVNRYFNSPFFYRPSGDFHNVNLLTDKAGNVWFGDLKIESGLYYYSAASKSIEAIKIDLENPYTIHQYGISAMYIDRSNNLWVGHNNAGLSICSLAKSPFNITVRQSLTNNLSSNHIHALCEDHNLNLWIGTDKGIDLLNSKLTEIIKHYYYNVADKKLSLSGRVAGSIVEDNSGKIWIGYIDSNPDLLNPANDEIHSFQFNPKINNSAYIWRTLSIAIDKSQNVWFTTGESGLAKYNNDGATFTYYSPGPNSERSNKPIFSKKNHISGYSLYSICEDHKGNLWIGSDVAGLSQFYIKTGEITNFTHSPNDNESLTSNFVRYVFCDHAGTIWIGTNMGFNKYIEETHKFVRYTTNEGLVGNTVQGIVEAENGILFISTNSGISRFDVNTETFTNFSTQNGLLSNEYSTGACLKRKSGELVFGSVNSGLVSFNPKELLIKSSNPSVLISDLRVGNNELKIGPDEILNQHILYTKKIVLPYAKSKDLTIEFLAINYALPESNVYRYMLKGNDLEWKTVDYTRRFAVYNQLEPRTYTFLVSASVDGKVWSTPTELEIAILPPWWETWWFLTLASLCILLIIYYIYLNRIKAYKRQQEVLEKEVADRTFRLEEAKQDVENKNIELEKFNHKLEDQNAEISEISNRLKELNELKTDFFTNISHELRTPLTIIKGLSENMNDKLDKKESKKLSEPLSVIQKNILLLIRYVNQLLNISLLDKGKMQPKIVEQDLSAFLNELAETFSIISEQYNVSFSYHFSGQIAIGYFDRDIIEHAIFNLLSNAFKFTADGGQINFFASTYTLKNVQWVQIKIEDNGIGIKKDEIDKIFDRFYRNNRQEFQRFESSGIGLAYCKEIITNHLGSINCVSEYGKGSTFTIDFSTAKEAYPAEWISLDNTASPHIADYAKELLLTSPITPQKSETVDFENKVTLLIVEDNLDLCLYLKDIFSDGFRITVAHNGKEAWDMLSEKMPDLIISDIMMPIMSGLDLCKKIKLNEPTSHIPVLLLTARSSEKQQLEGFETGADDYITKPFNADLLKAKVNSLLNQQRRLKSYFANVFDLDEPGPDLPEDERLFLEKATKVVLENMSNQDFDVDLFCSLMFMSRTNLFRKLKSTTGLSATAFTRNIRIKQAATLIKKRKYSINEISLMVGFVDPNYFSRCFKDMFDIAPSNY
ncbi:MAG: two-component regulator propeller domain-containing protein [Bacteroidales bacterium]|nr:two-component regulator propeller domain-containing protein [Bacteroidales bacterium]